LQQIGIHDNFLELGAHSLNIGAFVNRLHHESHIRLGLRDVFSEPTIAGLCKVAESRGLSLYEGIRPVAQQEHYALSHAQQRLWIQSLMADDKTAYNISGAYEITGALKQDVLQQVFEQLLQRYEILRTVFINAGSATRQKILLPAASGFALNYRNISGAQDPAAEAKRMAAADTLAAFDLSAGPLWRATLLQLAAGHYVLVFTWHHIIADALSMMKLMGEIIELYSALEEGRGNTLQPLAIQYKDYAVWQQQEAYIAAMQDHRQYWHQKLSGNLTVLEFPVDVPRSESRTYKGGRSRQFLDDVTARNFLRFIQEQDVTLFMGFLALVQTLAYRYTGTEDIILGTTVAGREHRDLEEQIGFFVNNLVLRMEVDGSDSFEQLLSKTKNMALEAYEHQEYPFDQLVGEKLSSRSAARSPFFDVLVECNNLSLDKQETAGLQHLQVTPFDSGVISSRYDLIFRCFEGEGMLLEIEYNVQLYTENTINRMMEHMVNLLLHILQNRQAPLSKLPYMSAVETRQLLDFSSIQYQQLPATDVVTLLEKQLLQTPQLPALVSGTVSISYAEMHAAANKLARHLNNTYHVQPGDRVAIMLNASAEMIIGLLGILKSGAAYVPVDPAFPAERKHSIAAEAEVKVLLTDAQHMLSMDFYEGPVFALDVQLPFLDEEVTALQVPLQANDLAYILYTSGSTGKPKGVAIGHGALVTYLSWAAAYYVDAHTSGHFSLFTPLTFDLTVTSIFCPLITGNTLYIEDADQPLSETLRQVFSDAYPVEIVKLTPAHISLLPQLAITRSNIKKVIAGGDMLTHKHISILRNINPQIRIINEYGPTEATVGCIVKEISEETRILIGRPVTNTGAYILDNAMQLVPVGNTGELFLTGSNLAAGYFRRPDLTEQQFKQHLFGEQRLYRTGDLARWLPDGNIECLGRKDDQVKVNGYRVELREIEERLVMCPGIQAAGVICKKQESADVLLAFVEAAEPLNVPSINQYLRQYLPAYMLPAVITQVPALPLTANGKVNYKLLQEKAFALADTPQTIVPPRNTLDQELLGWWQALLEKDAVSITDNFFEIGGNSLRLILLFNKISQQYPDVKMSHLFNYPTIQLQSDFIDGLTGDAAAESSAAGVKEISF
ncbi:amino acid adenylation domain-containing protein, partial [Chitinophaga rupis]